MLTTDSEGAAQVVPVFAHDGEAPGPNGRA